MNKNDHSEDFIHNAIMVTGAIIVIADLVLIGLAWRLLS